MMKKYPVVKWFIVAFLGLIIGVISFGYWFMSLIPSGDGKTDLSQTLPDDLSYLSQNVIPKRGKVLAVVTSCDVMGSSQKKTGYELTELSRTYYVLQANGFDVDVASPKGGEPPVIIDYDDMGVFDYAFLNDSVAQYKSNHTIPIADINAEDYDAVFFAGGKGAMFDFPDNSKIQSIVKSHYESGKVVGAVCHGPAALINVVLDDGSSLLANKEISSFTNSEELLLIPDAESIFPFLLEDELVAKGAHFNEGYLYLENISEDGNLITGQNPWSTWAMAESMVRQLGYMPKERVITAEENTIHILTVYESQGYNEAKGMIELMLVNQLKPMDRVLLAMHSMVAVMQWDFRKSFDLIGLLAYAKEVSVDDD